MTGGHGKQGHGSQAQLLARLRSEYTFGRDTQRRYLLDHGQRNDKACARRRLRHTGQGLRIEMIDRLVRAEYVVGRSRRLRGKEGWC